MKNHSPKYHQGITMHALQVGGCVAGAIFAVGVMAIVLAGVPFARWFFLAAAAGGIAAFLLIRWSHQSN